MNINQWKNTEGVIDWFEKNSFRISLFLTLRTLYTPIKESLLKQSLYFEENYVKVSNENKAIMKHARKFLLFNKKKT